MDNENIKNILWAVKSSVDYSSEHFSNFFLCVFLMCVVSPPFVLEFFLFVWSFCMHEKNNLYKLYQSAIKHALQWNLYFENCKVCFLNMKMFLDIRDTFRIHETEWTQMICFVTYRIPVSTTYGNSISTHTIHFSGMEINKWLYLCDFKPLTFI